MLVVELDGSQHGESETIAYDATRTRYIAATGYEVLRFWNGDAMARTVDVLETIYATVARRLDGRQLSVRAVAAGHLPPVAVEDD